MSERAGSFIKDAVAYLSKRTKLLLRRQDPLGIHQDFELHLLEVLRANKANQYGVPCVGVTASLNGDVSAKFLGFDHDGRWRKFSIRLNFPLLHQKKHLGDVNAVADCFMQFLATRSTVNDLPPWSAAITPPQQDQHGVQ